MSMSSMSLEDQLGNAPALAGGWDASGERNIHKYYHASPY
jgi:hypothetical protein